MGELTLQVQTRYFDAIVSGLKTVEGRIAKPEYRALKPNGLITFIDPNGKSCTAEICRVTHFTDFREMLENSTVQACIPGASLDKALEIYRSFPGYREKEKEFGVVAIHIKLR
jgi:ASC-1-like (ASCH) protein